MIDQNLHFESHFLFHFFRVVRRSAFRFFRRLRSNAFPRAATFLMRGQRGDGWVEIDGTQQGVFRRLSTSQSGDSVEQGNKSLPHTSPCFGSVNVFPLKSSRAI